MPTPPHVPAIPRLPSLSSPPAERAIEILGRRAKAGEVTLAELDQAYVKRLYALTGQNASETARLAEIDRKKVTRPLDLGRLSRWLRGRR